jgi:CRISPR-associated helicase Cas3/CRISPR-associated endonuclease Cas3-HD
MVNQVYYAHTKKDARGNALPEIEWQTLEAHLTEVAKLAAESASVFGADALGAAIGLLHDAGKATPEFDARLHGKAVHVDHKSLGASVAAGKYPKPLARLMAYCILGHHGGLPNHSDEVMQSLNPADAPESLAELFSSLPADIAVPCFRLPSENGKIDETDMGAYVQLLIRMAFSALVDGDYLDTAQFMTPQLPALQYEAIDATALPAMFAPTLAKLRGYDLSLTVNRARRKVLDACVDAGALGGGFYTLTVPTGGGKTLSSLAFAMRQIEQCGMRRVIYAAPFTTITEQTTDIFRGIFGDDAVLEHHSNLDISEKTDNERDTLRLVSERWDAPLIVTTTVQLIESLFSHKPTRARKIRNLARSVIIFDEAQALPDKYLLPIVTALKSLVANFGATVMLCTATQPRLAPSWMKGLDVREIIPEPQRLFDELRRVEITHIGAVSDDALTARIASGTSALIIVNTRTHARGLYNLLKTSRGEDGTYHLSALMCPEHRTRTLKAIKKRLENKEPCVVVSTNLVEAGVDIDFPVVYRAEAGLESVAQSAGRCNREGSPTIGSFYIFKPQDARTPRYLSENTGFGQQALAMFPDDPLSPSAVERYFEMRYHDEKRLDQFEILNDWRDGVKKFEFNFKTIGDNFRLIDRDTQSVIIPYDAKAIELLQNPEHHLRRLQRYTVSVYTDNFRENAGLRSRLNNIADGVWMLREKKTETYSDETGLVSDPGLEFLG